MSRAAARATVVRQRIRRLAARAVVLSSTALCACGDSPSEVLVRGAPGITIVSRPTGQDTIATPYAEPLVLQLRRADSLPAAGQILWLKTPYSQPHFACPIALYRCIARLVEFEPGDSIFRYGESDWVRADQSGRVLLKVRNGLGSGSGAVVLEMRDSVTNRVQFTDSLAFTVRPGRPALTRISPAPITTLSIGRQWTVPTFVFDRGGALLTAAPTLSTSAGAAVAGQTITATALQDGWVVASVPGATPDSARVNVVPAGQLAGITCYLCSQVTLIDTDGQNRRVVSLPATVTSMEWLPDGSRLIVAIGNYNDFGQSPQLVSVGPDGTVSPFTTEPAVPYASRPRVAGSGASGRLYISAGPSPRGGLLHRLRSDGTGLAMILSADGVSGLSGSLEVAPNARTYAYFTSTYGFSFVDAATGAFSSVPLIDVFKFNPFPFDNVVHLRWSPDGSAIAFAGVYGVGVMNADGTNQRAFKAYDAQAVNWSPDGRWLLSATLGGSFVLDPVTLRQIVLPLTLGAAVWRPQP